MLSIGAVTASAMGRRTAVAAVFDIHIDRKAETASIVANSSLGLRPARAMIEIAAR